MPLFEAACPSESCPNFGRPIEHYYHHATDDMMPCKVCGGPTRKMISTFASPLMGTIVASKYADRSIEGKAAHMDGHYVWERKSPDGKGKPKARWISTFEEQRAFCKSEGLLNPSEVPKHMEPGEHGKGVSSQGMPGSWI